MPAPAKGAEGAARQQGQPISKYRRYAKANPFMYVCSSVACCRFEALVFLKAGTYTRLSQNESLDDMGALSKAGISRCTRKLCKYHKTAFCQKQQPRPTWRENGREIPHSVPILTAQTTAAKAGLLCFSIVVAWLRTLELLYRRPVLHSQALSAQTCPRPTDFARSPAPDRAPAHPGPSSRLAGAPAT